VDVEILLVSAEWRLRVPVRAQLIEDGFEVDAHEAWEFAELLLRSGARHPRLVIFDASAEDHPTALLGTLARLVPPERVLVLTAPSVLPTADITGLGFPHVLARPFSVGDIVAQAGHLLGRAPRRS
jgi:DNA-binding response OmpR family regulator